MPSSLNVSFCQDITALKDFLRLSRTLVDDTITQNLNNLVLPPRFDPASTSRPEKKRMEAPINGKSCNSLIETVFQNWDARTSTIDYCLQTIKSTPFSSHSLSADEIRARRLDPYSGRQTEELPILRTVCDQEQGTERIVRDRTWRVIRGRCEEMTGMDSDWEKAFSEWRKKKDNSSELLPEFNEQ